MCIIRLHKIVLYGVASSNGEQLLFKSTVRSSLRTLLRLIIKLHIWELLKYQSPVGWCSSTTEVLNCFSENNWQIDWQPELNHMDLLITDFINY